MMATAFMGYVLPWGQMSYWAATVITNLLSALPVVGEALVGWVWGGFSVDNPTLVRFYALHFLLPFVIVGLVGLHLWALHHTKSGNPLGIDTTGPQDFIRFHPYYTIKDAFGAGMFLLVFAVFLFYAPNYLGHPDNYIPRRSPQDTAAHRSGMVFPAVLRDLARHSLQVGRRHCHGAVDRHPVPPALARHVQSPFGDFPSGVQVVLLDPGDRHHRAGRRWRQSA